MFCLKHILSYLDYIDLNIVIGIVLIGSFISFSGGLGIKVLDFIYKILSIGAGGTFLYQTWKASSGSGNNDGKKDKNKNKKNGSNKTSNNNNKPNFKK